MSRVLVMTERTLSVSDRTSYVARLTDLRQKATAVGANFWVFEKDNAPESFLEFVEAGSVQSLVAALASMSDVQHQPHSLAPVWREVTGV